MAAPKFVPSPPIDSTRTYSSPPINRTVWMPDRPAEVTGFQPSGEQLGYQGPDQGFGLKIANGFADRLQLRDGEHAADAIRGCLGVALKRASLFSRAPVVHDFTIAFTIWGFLDANPPAELVTARRVRFDGLSHGGHYSEARAIADLVPVATLRRTPQQVAAEYPSQWRALLGL